MDNLYNRVARRRRKGEEGFTLIELLVVIAILSVLAAIVVFNVTGVKNRGDAAACSTDVKSVQSAVDAWINDNSVGNAPGAFPFTGTINSVSTTAQPWSSLVPVYLHSVPPVTGATNECQTTPMAIGKTTTAVNGGSVTTYTVTGA